MGDIEEGRTLPDEGLNKKLEKIFDWPLLLPPAKLASLKFGDWEKPIDERIVPFAREMLLAGFPTWMCGIDNLGVTIFWFHSDRAATFLNIVAPFEQGPDTGGQSTWFQCHRWMGPSADRL